jgi:(R,R)-butanediol dehydrogenase/meso-butanediol dehydrogenase/diacetyl reductase
VGTLVVSEVSRTRAALALRSGADAVVDPGSENVVEAVGSIVGFGPGRRGAAADVVFDCAGVPAAFSAALRLVRPGGTVAITALYEEVVEFSPSRLVWGEVRVVGTFGYRNEFPQTIELLRSGKVNTTALVTDVFPLDHTNAGFQRQLAKDQAMKVMIQP